MKRYRLTESRLRGMIHEAVKNILRENNFTEFDNYSGFPVEEKPNNDKITTKQIKQLNTIVNSIAGIANNTSENTDLLFNAINNIEKFIEEHTELGPYEDDPYYFGS
jgi:hypothetical protein